jgi:hypothetical protein
MKERRDALPGRSSCLDEMGKHGPGPMFAKVVERFHPEAFYGNPSRRQVFLVADLESPAKMAELMYVLTRFTGTEPTLAPVMRPEVYAEAIQDAKRIVTPPA